MTKQQVWLKAYIAAIRRGHDGTACAQIADGAIKDFTERFLLSDVGSRVSNDKSYVKE